jgi:hypothetical protein
MRSTLVERQWGQATFAFSCALTDSVRLKSESQALQW